jgi:hypothetical protein
MAENVTVETAWEWPSSEQLESADVMLFFQRGSWNDERAGQIDAFLARGGGLVYIHWAVEAGPEAESFARRIGLASNGGRLKFRHGPLQLVFDRDTAHPVTRNLRRAEFLDESYWQMVGDAGSINTLGTGVEEGAPRPLFWTYEPEAGGKVFVSILGHYSWTFDDPLFRVLLLRGTAWAAGEEVDRFNELVTVGVDVRTE